MMIHFSYFPRNIPQFLICSHFFLMKNKAYSRQTFHQIQWDLYWSTDISIDLSRFGEIYLGFWWISAMHHDLISRRTVTLTDPTVANPKPFFGRCHAVLPVGSRPVLLKTQFSGVEFDLMGNPNSGHHRDYRWIDEVKKSCCGTQILTTLKIKSTNLFLYSIYFYYYL